MDRGRNRNEEDERGEGGRKYRATTGGKEWEK